MVTNKQAQYHKSRIRARIRTAHSKYLQETKRPKREKVAPKTPEIPADLPDPPINTLPYDYWATFGGEKEESKPGPPEKKDKYEDDNDGGDGDGDDSKEPPDLGDIDFQELIRTATTTKLYDNATLSVLEAVVLFFQYISHSNTPQIHVNSLTKLMGVLLPPGHKFPPSYYMLMKYFAINYHATKQFYCHNCWYLYTEADREAKFCPQPFCNTPRPTGRTQQQFILSVDVSKELEKKIMRKGMSAKLNYLNTRKKIHEHHLEDIYDGRRFRHLRENYGWFRSVHDVGLVVGLDGVSLFSQSNVQAWPIWAIICNLPPSERYKEQNMMLIGLWVGPSHPHMHQFLQPIVRDLISLSQGVSLRDEFGVPHQTRAVLLALILDLMAKAPVQELGGPGSLFGCSRCLEKCEVVDKHKHYLQNKTDAPLRTKQNTIFFAQLAQSAGYTAVCGVKGVSPLALVPYFDYLLDSVIDSMHHLFLHVVKELLDIWFNEEYQDTEYYPWSLYSQIEEINRDLRAVQIPHGRENTPRSLHDRRKWKAAELRYFCLYLALPLLGKRLPPNYVLHLRLFVEGLWLVAYSIDPAKLPLAHFNFRLFVAQYPVLYGPRFSGLEVHMVKHIIQDVDALGPLFTHSMFALEHMGGRAALTCFAKKTAIAHSIFHHFLTQYNHRAIVESMHLTHSSSIALMLVRLGGGDYFENPHLLSKSLTVLRDTPKLVCVMGKPTKIAVPRYMYATVTMAIPGPQFASYDIPALKYQKILVGEQRFYSAEYKRKYLETNELKRLSFIVAYQQTDDQKEPSLGCAHAFLRIWRGEQEYLLASIAPLRGVSTESPTRHPTYRTSWLVQWPPPDQPSIAVRVESILYKCLVIRITGERDNGQGVAHIIEYIHKTTLEPRWWLPSEGRGDV